MKVALCFLLMVISCAEVPERKPSSDTIISIGEISHHESSVQIFPAELEDGSVSFYFYLQLKDSAGRYVDSDLSEVKIRSPEGDDFEFTYERLRSGRYYLMLKAMYPMRRSKWNFYLRGKILKKGLKFSYAGPDKTHTRITLLHKTSDTVQFRLKLADKDNRPVETHAPPEIVLDGLGRIDDLRHIQEGIWEFTLIYPELNQIFYFSVRSQGVYFPMIYRYQHVEK